MVHEGLLQPYRSWTMNLTRDQSQQGTPGRMQEWAVTHFSTRVWKLCRRVALWMV